MSVILYDDINYQGVGRQVEQRGYALASDLGGTERQEFRTGRLLRRRRQGGDPALQFEATHGRETQCSDGQRAPGAVSRVAALRTGATGTAGTAGTATPAGGATAQGGATGSTLVTAQGGTDNHTTSGNAAGAGASSTPGGAGGSGAAGVAGATGEAGAAGATGTAQGCDGLDGNYLLALAPENTSKSANSATKFSLTLTSTNDGCEATIAPQFYPRRGCPISCVTVTAPCSSGVGGIAGRLAG